MRRQALNHARTKLRALEQDTRFKPEEKQFLTDQWRRLRDETERAGGHRARESFICVEGRASAFAHPTAEYARTHRPGSGWPGIRS